MFAVGDIVVGVNSTEKCRCPVDHSSNAKSLEKVAGKYFKILEVYDNHGRNWFSSACPVRVAVDPHVGRSGYWCAGAFRKVQKADQKFIEELQKIKPKVDA